MKKWGSQIQDCITIRLYHARISQLKKHELKQKQQRRHGRNG